MSHTIGEQIVRRLIASGVPRVYGYPGDRVNGILGGFHEAGNELEFVQTRHEEPASHQACADASGRMVRQSLKGEPAEFLTR